MISTHDHQYWGIDMRDVRVFTPATGTSTGNAHISSPKLHARASLSQIDAGDAETYTQAGRENRTRSSEGPESTPIGFSV